MALTERELDIARQVKEQGGTEEDFMEILQQVRGEQPEVVEEEAVTIAPVMTTGVIPTQTPAPETTGDKVMGGLKTFGKGISSTLTGITGGIEEVGQGVADLTKTGLSKLGVPMKKPGEIGTLGGVVKPTMSPQESVLGIGKGSLGLGFTAAFPATTVLLNTAGETETGKKLLLPVAEAITKGGEIINKTPGLSEFRASLPEDKKQDFDAFTAQVVTLGLAKGASSIISKYKANSVAKLEKQATRGVEEFIKPTKEATKQITKEITPTILEKGIKGTREQVALLAEENIARYGKEIGKFIEEGKVKGEIPLDKMVETLAKVDKELRFEGKVLPGREAQVAYLDKQLDFLSNVQKKFGNNLPAEQQIMLKRSFDTVFDKTVTRDKISKFQDEVDVKLADTLRTELAKNNPEFAKLNKEFSFYKGLDKVMQETLSRTTGQAEIGLLDTIKGAKGAGIGAGIGGAAGSTLGPVGAFVGATIGGAMGNSVEKLVSNPKWKLVSAVHKAELAKALAEGKATKIENIIKTIQRSVSIPTSSPIEEILKEKTSKLTPLGGIESILKK